MKKYAIYVAIIAILGVGFYQKVFIPKHTFKVTQASKGFMNIQINGIGNVGAKYIYKIGSTYGGKVLDFNLSEGDKVTKGQILAKIDFVDLKDKILELSSTINKLADDLQSLKIQKQSAIITYDYQLDVYKKNMKLYKKNAISELEFKKYKTNKENAKLQITNLQAKIDSLKNQIASTKYSAKGLQTKLTRYTIISPVSGVVTKKLVSNYQVVMPNQAMLEIVNPKDVWIKAYIDTRLSGDVKIGDTASVKFRSSNKIYPAKVVAINPNNNPITYEREIDVRLNTPLSPFYMQEQAQITIHTERLSNITKIPVNVISFYKEKNGIWILQNNKAHFQAIKILAYGKKFVAINNLDNLKILIPNPKNKPLSEGMKIYND